MEGGTVIREISVTWIRPRHWEKPIEYRLNESIRLGGHIVPAGFVTDGNSTPPPLRWLFRPYGKMFPAAIVHDWLTRTEKVSRREADRIYLDIGKVEGVSGWTRYPMFYAVRIYSGAIYLKSKITKGA